MFDLLFSNLLEKSPQHNVPFSVLVLVFGKMGEDPDEVFFVFTPEQGLEVGRQMQGRLSDEAMEALSRFLEEFDGYEHSSMKMRHYTGEEGVVHAFFSELLRDMYDEIFTDDEDTEPDEEEETPAASAPKRSRSDLPN